MLKHLNTAGKVAIIDNHMSHTDKRRIKAVNIFTRMRAVGRYRSAHAVFAFLVPMVCLFTMELLHRGTLWKNFLENAFWENFESYFLT